MYSVRYQSALSSKSRVTLYARNTLPTGLLKKGLVSGSGLRQHPPKNTDKQQKERNRKQETHREVQHFHEKKASRYQSVMKTQISVYAEC